MIEDIGIAVLVFAAFLGLKAVNSYLERLGFRD
jgi:hypothetical protein